MALKWTDVLDIAIELNDAHPDAIEAMMRAEHGDPFAVLGPHEVGEGQWEVRAVLPEARAATVVIGDTRVPMERRHPAGFFVASFAHPQRPDYRLAVEGWDNTERTRRDPYEYGATLNQQDIGLMILELIWVRSCL